ncbi:MAG: hypothetical protein WAX69_18940 [Victivallales bacterium]
MSRLIYPCLIALICLITGIQSSLHAEDAWKKQFNAVEFDRANLVNPSNVEKVKAAGNLAGKIQPKDWFAIAGNFEYDFSAPADGWYEMLVQPASSAGSHEFSIDGKDSAIVTWGGDKIGNYWLAAGKHTMRVQRYIWTGFSPITGFTIQKSGTELCRNIRIKQSSDRNVLRKGETFELELASTAAGTITACVTDTDSKTAVGRYPLKLSASEKPATSKMSIPCQKEGVFTITFEIDGKAMDRDLPPVRFTVIDTAPEQRTGGEIKKSLVQEIDCVTTSPDYSGAGGSQIVKKPFGSYRESGAVGWIQNQNATDCSWFAYKMTVPEAQQPYILEVDYPDDAFRTFCVAIKESAVASYPIVGGVDCGGEFSLSNSMLTHSIVFWPLTADLRILLITPQTGRRAAANRIRLFKVEGGFPLPSLPSAGARQFANWYEEGTNFLGFYGIQSANVKGIMLGADRWARSIAWMGGDTLVPTVSVYQMNLFPSRFNISFTDPSATDTVRIILMKCEKYGMKFIGEFHPEARELAWGSPAYGGIECTYLISKDGKTGGNGPKFNPIHPKNSEWYLGMIGEFVDRYKDSPSLQGVSLRMMTWVNPALNNFHSLDWGYDDYTIGLFEKEAGVKIPLKAAGHERFKARYDWLIANAREKWITWRCAKIADLYRRISERVQKARPDLLVYSDIFGGFPDDLREAGVDTRLLSTIGGVRLVNSLHGYGRRQHSEMETQEARDALMSPSSLNAVSNPADLNGYLFGAGYFEAIETVVPPDAIGLPANSKRTWMSGVVNPAGRHALERWAIAVAEGDAIYLSDGGNAYTLGQPILQEFLQEYRRLPCVKFTPIKEASDPVAVRQSRRSGQRPVTSGQKNPNTNNQSPITDNFLFYAVSRVGYPVQLDIQFAQPGFFQKLFGKKITVKRLSTGETVPLKDGLLNMELKPYQLLAFSTDPDAEILKVKTNPPVAELAKISRQVEWLEKLSKDIAAGRIKAKIEPADRKTLDAMAVEARASLAAGHLWQVSGIMQNHKLLKIYQLTDRFPPSSHFRVNLAAQKMSHGLLRFLNNKFPQKDLSNPGDLLPLISPDKGSPELALCKESGCDFPLVTWAGNMARLRLPFTVREPLRFRIWLRMAVFSGSAELFIVDAKGKEIALKPLVSETGLQTAESTEPITLLPGDTQLTFRNKGTAPVYLEQVFLEPVPTRISTLQFVGYFPNPDNKNWTVPLPPEGENGRSATAVFDGTDGKSAGKVSWKPMPKELINAQAHVAVCPPGPLGPEVIAYCRTTIKSPDARDASLLYLGADNFRIFLNGELVLDTIKDKIDVWWPSGFKILPVKLKKGSNELLVKMANKNGSSAAYKIIYFEGMITDPGDLAFLIEDNVKQQ